MESVTRTIYSAHLSTAKLLNRPFNVLVNSTLNQKFNIYPGEVPAANEYPALGYLAIGNKGSTYDVTGTGFVLTTPIPHLPRHASLYNHIPFIVRPVASDLTSTERLNYRMRVPVTIGGVNYIAYYLKTLGISAVTPSVELRNVNNGTITTNAFIPALSDLTPTQVVVSNVNVNNPNGDYLVSTAKTPVLLNQQDITEILNACTILFGDARYAVINEIALCTGIDRVLSGSFNGVTANYTEVVATQIAAFISQHHTLTAATTQVQLEFDIGSVEPLIV